MYVRSSTVCVARELALRNRRQVQWRAPTTLGGGDNGPASMDDTGAE